MDGIPDRGEETGMGQGYEVEDQKEQCEKNRFVAEWSKMDDGRDGSSQVLHVPF